MVEASAFNNGCKRVSTLKGTMGCTLKGAEFKACFSVFFFVFLFVFFFFLFFVFFFKVQIQREVGNREKRSDHGSRNRVVGPRFEWFPAFLA